MVECNVPPAQQEEMPPWGRLLLDMMGRIENRLAISVQKETYTISEAAKRLGKSDWTVRQWCNKGQVEGAKKIHGQGRTGEWRIPHDSLLRLQNEGPGPLT